ncbi:hypothetical protein CALCODRAFT_495683 [Calocera cornea HHB12733]|uniref:Uncharacterized protein n=1 Tax=Calocera cornea HHB12733 TaxID=1353952 RepID=A0A165GB84_9BASI|nr:hypothetical protein CALCODRAFT_495683 [Calocera cornea HHB12733]
MRRGSEASSDGGDGENDVQDFISMWTAKNANKKKKQEKELLKLMDKTKHDYLRRVAEIREDTKQKMSDVYVDFLEKDAEISKNIRTLWVKVLETHKTVHTHAEDAAKAHATKAEAMGNNLEDVEKQINDILESEEQLLEELATV